MDAHPVPAEVWTIVNAEGLQPASTSGWFASEKNAQKKLRGELRMWQHYADTWGPEHNARALAMLAVVQGYRVIRCEVVVPT